MPWAYASWGFESVIWPWIHLLYIHINANNIPNELKETTDAYQYNKCTYYFFRSIAPSEGKQPTWMLSDDCCEKLAFQYLFPEGRFGYKHTRELKLSTLISISWISHKCLYQILTIFYALPVTQLLKLNSEIDIALRNAFTGTVTAEILSWSFAETVQSFVGKD